mgnify:FL=1
MVKKLDIKKVGLSLFLGVSLCITGCGSKSEEAKISQSDVSENTQETDSQVEQSSQEEDTLTPQEQQQLLSGENKIQTESDVATYYESVKNTLQEYINKENAQKALQAGEDVLKKGAKFLVGTEPIGGYYISDLSEETKERFINTFDTIDSMVEQKFPNYKERVSNATSQLIDKGKEKANEFKDYARRKLEENLTEEQLQSLDDAVEKGKTTYSEAKDYVTEKGSQFSDWLKEKKDDVKQKIIEW